VEGLGVKAGLRAGGYVCVGEAAVGPLAVAHKNVQQRRPVALHAIYYKLSP
jgi:hypothetical protein